MAINWETGEITNEPHRLRAEQRQRVVGHLQDLELAYILHQGLAADQEDTLWLDPASEIFSEQEAGEDLAHMTICRVLKINEGIVVDSLRSDDESDEVDFVTHFGFDFEVYGWVPIIGLVETQAQRIALEGSLYQKYGFMMGTPILNALVDREIED